MCLRQRDNIQILQVFLETGRECDKVLDPDNGIGDNKYIITVAHLPRKTFTKSRESHQESLPEDRCTTNIEELASKPSLYRELLEIFVDHDIMPKTIVL